MTCAHVVQDGTIVCKTGRHPPHKLGPRTDDGRVSLTVRDRDPGHATLSDEEKQTMQTQPTDAEVLGVLREIGAHVKLAARQTQPRAQPTADEVLGVMRQVGAHAAKLNAKAAARRRASDVRDVARDLERLAATVERHEIAADRLRAAAKHYGAVADTLACALRAR